MSKYHLPEDKDGFRSFNPTDHKTYPEPFDMVLLALSDGKVKSGWHQGMGKWHGLRLKKSDVVVAFKRNHGLY